jgi:hypothetical protein
MLRIWLAASPDARRHLEIMLRLHYADTIPDPATMDSAAKQVEDETLNTEKKWPA